MKKYLAIIPLAAALFASSALAQSPPNTAAMVPNGGGSSGGGSPTGAAGGGLSGTYPNPTLANPSASTLGGVESLAPTTHQWINSISTSGVPSSTQPASTDLSDTTAEGAWTPTDQSGAALTFTAVAASFSKSNKTCVGQFRLNYPTTASGSNASISLPCTSPATGVPQVVGICDSGAASPNALMAIQAPSNSASAIFIGTTGAATTNVLLTGIVVSCNFSFNSQ